MPAQQRDIAGAIDLPRSTLILDPTRQAELQRSLGWDRDLASCPEERQRLRSYIAFQMASAGLSPPDAATNADSMATFSAGILESLREKNRLLAEHRAPIDSRIESFLNRYFAAEVDSDPLRLPSRSLTLDRHGMARELSLPVNGQSFKNELVESYRCLNGVLNNPGPIVARPRAHFMLSKAGCRFPVTSEWSRKRSS